VNQHGAGLGPTVRSHSQQGLGANWSHLAKPVWCQPQATLQTHERESKFWVVCGAALWKQLTNCCPLLPGSLLLLLTGLHLRGQLCLGRLCPLSAVLHVLTISVLDRVKSSFSLSAAFAGSIRNHCSMSLEKTRRKQPPKGHLLWSCVCVFFSSPQPPFVCQLPRKGCSAATAILPHVALQASPLRHLFPASLLALGADLSIWKSFKGNRTVKIETK
jgi:hypothetical protein